MPNNTSEHPQPTVEHLSQSILERAYLRIKAGFIKAGKALRCVDGRKCEESEQGPQLLGGVILPTTLAAIDSGEALTELFVDQKVQTLKEHHLDLGVHRGSHVHVEDGISDCGFADKLPMIIRTAQDKRDEILGIIESVSEAHKEVFNKHMPILSTALITQAYEQLSKYDVELVEFKGESLVGHFEQEHESPCETLVDNHAERAAVLNFETGMTLDTQTMNIPNQDGISTQAFNLDLWRVPAYAEALGIDPTVAQIQSIILFIATEMVLVEKGDSTKRLPIFVRG